MIYSICDCVPNEHNICKQHVNRYVLDVTVTAEIMQSMGYTREQLEESLFMHRYDDVSATYHLLGLKPGTVCSKNSSLYVIVFV